MSDLPVNPRETEIRFYEQWDDRDLEAAIFNLEALLYHEGYKILEMDAKEHRDRGLFRLPWLTGDEMLQIQGETRLALHMLGRGRTLLAELRDYQRVREEAEIPEVPEKRLDSTGLKYAK